MGDNVDLEKGAGPHSPNSQSTWESQDGTLNSSVLTDRIEIEEDFDGESGKCTPPTQDDFTDKRHFKYMHKGRPLFFLALSRQLLPGVLPSQMQPPFEP